jgi:MFS family permease
MGAAASGALLGPVLGAVASAVGVRPTFIGVSALGLTLAGCVLTTPGERPHPQPLSALKRADRGLAGGMWLVVLPAVLYGVVTVLVPLKLHRLGWSGVAIGALFFAGAAFETVFNPLLGRFADRRGNLIPVRAALAASVAISLALAWAGAGALVALLLLAAAIAFNAFYTPAMALISSGAERRGIALGLVFGAMNGVWAAGNVVGPALGGALAQAAGDAVPYVLLAAICLLTLLATLPAAPAYLQPRSRPRSS